MLKFIALIMLVLPIISNSQEMLKLNNYSSENKAGTVNSLILGSLLVFTPGFVHESSKGYFGLSKELSLGKFPYGRAEFDYTFVFRSNFNSLAHISYNLDIPTNFNFKSPSIFMFTPGAGYYTNFTDKGYFTQLAFGLWVSTGIMDGLSIHPNVKIRKVFKDSHNPGLFEASLGVGFGFYTR